MSIFKNKIYNSIIAYNGKNNPIYKNISFSIAKIIKKELEELNILEELVDYYPNMIFFNIESFIEMKNNHEIFMNINKEKGLIYSSYQLIQLNSSILNILTSFRAKLDFTSHTLSNLFGKNNFIISFYEYMQSEMYDKYFEYRFIYKFRNYSQHFGIPIHDLKSDPNFLKKGSYKSLITLNSKKLLKFKKWSKKIEEEISELETIDLVDTFLKFKSIILDMKVKLFKELINKKYFSLENSLNIANDFYKSQQDSIPALWIKENKDFNFI